MTSAVKWIGRAWRALSFIGLSLAVLVVLNVLFVFNCLADAVTDSAADGCP